MFGVKVACFFRKPATRELNKILAAYIKTVGRFQFCFKIVKQLKNLLLIFFELIAEAGGSIFSLGGKTVVEADSVRAFLKGLQEMAVYVKIADVPGCPANPTKRFTQWPRLAPDSQVRGESEKFHRGFKPAS